MTHNTTPSDKQAHSQDINQEVTRTLTSIHFDLVEIIIHESEVVQIECSGIRIQLRTAIASPNDALAIQMKAPIFSALKYPSEHLNKK